jgi:hypothetical protein
MLKRSVKLRALFLLVPTIGLAGCDLDSTEESAENEKAANHSCAGQPGWERATAVSPDVVPPCKTGSTGTCATSGYRYLTGTGWCKPE